MRRIALPKRLCFILKCFRVIKNGDNENAKGAIFQNQRNKLFYFYYGAMVIREDCKVVVKSTPCSEWSEICSEW